MTWVYMVGGPKAGELLDIDVRAMDRVNVPVMDPLDVASMFQEEQPPLQARSFRVEVYQLERISWTDGWQQFVLVHQSRLQRGEVPRTRLSDQECIAATMEPWRATWARTYCHHCGERIINRYRYATRFGVQVVLSVGWRHATGGLPGAHDCVPLLAPYGSVAHPKDQDCPASCDALGKAVRA